MRIVTAVALFVALAACDVIAPRPSAVPTAPSAKPPPNYSFVLATPSGMLALDAKGVVVGSVAQLPKDSAPSYPSLMPNRKTLVFGITLVPTDATGFGSDVW